MSGAGRAAGDAQRAWPGRRAAANGAVAVLLPGSGSDDVFVRAAFGGPLRAVGIGLVAPAPRPGAAVLDGYRAALDDALDRTGGPLLVGGVSFGAHVATRWAAAHRDRVSGLLLALPAWTGTPGSAPAALAALATADQVRAGGVDAAVSAARAGTPSWLADELERAWLGHGDGLDDALARAAGEPAPDERELATLTMPAGVVGLADDPVHPIDVAKRWQARLPRATLVTGTLAALGADPALLGRAAVLAWLRARAGGAVSPRAGAVPVARP